MGLPARLLDASSELERIADEEDVQAPIDVIIERTKRIEGILKAIKVDEIFSETERSAMVAGPAGANLLEQTIDQIHARESALAAKFRPMIQAARVLRTKTFRARHLGRQEKAKIVLGLDRHAKVLVSVLELFRDERWRMMTLLARVESTGDAPVFSDPQELEAYLGKF